MFNLGFQEIGLILVIALVVFGPGKLPEVGKALGKGLGELRRAADEVSLKSGPVPIEPQEDSRKETPAK